MRHPDDRHDPRKRSVTLDPAILEEAAREAERLGMSLSRVFRFAWKISRKKIAMFPGSEG